MQIEPDVLLVTLAPGLPSSELVTEGTEGVDDDVVAVTLVQGEGAIRVVVSGVRAILQP